MPSANNDLSSLARSQGLVGRSTSGKPFVDLGQLCEWTGDELRQIRVMPERPPCQPGESVVVQIVQRAGRPER